MSTLVALVGKKIKNIRKQKNMTQEELSEKSGLQTSFLAGVERGERNITLQTLERIIDGLEEEPQNLFSFSGLEISEGYQNRKEMISIINSMLLDKSEKEIKMINTIIKNIFETYHK
jgi:transcriptional regulator with XRE-family HTH domain